MGWNWTNSRSRSTAPARSASAIPSPVETAGLVDWEKTWPRPPLASTTARQCTAPTPSRWPSPSTCRVTPATPPSSAQQQVDGQRVLDDLDLRRPLDGGDQRALDLGAGGVAAGVRDAVAVVAALAGQRQLAVGVVVEVGAERDQLAHRLGALVDQHPYGVHVAGAGARDEGVVLVLLGGVPRAERGGDPALGPLGRAGGEHVLGDHQHLAATGSAASEAQRRGQPGDAGADHDDVGGGGPAGLGARRRPRERRRCRRHGASGAGSAADAGRRGTSAGRRRSRPGRSRWPGSCCRRRRRRRAAGSSLASAVSIWP